MAVANRSLRRGVNYARLALMAGVSIAAALGAGPAFSQDTPATPTGLPAEGQEDESAPIVVTGIRETIQTSIQTKRDSDTIVDAVSSKEIGELPGQSVGEVIATITGASIDRANYGPTEVSIRGLGSGLSMTTMNGREATNGSGDRAVNFGQFPSELFNAIKIYKTQQANLIEGGVAGLIELETRKPLDYKRRSIQAEIKGNYNPYQDRIAGQSGFGHRATISYIDQFKAGSIGEIGISIGYQRNDVNDPVERFYTSSTWFTCNAAIVSTANCTEVTRQQGNAGTPFFHASNSYLYRQMITSDLRNAVFGALQWQPSPTLDINLDVQYSRRQYSETRNDFGTAEGRYNLRNVVIGDDHQLLSADGSATLQTVSGLFKRDEKYLGLGGNVEWKPTDRLTVTADMGYSHTTRLDITRQVRLRTDPFDIYGVRTPINNQRIPYHVDMTQSFLPVFTYDARFDPADYEAFSDDARLTRSQDGRDDEIYAGRLDASYALDGFINRIEIGGRWAKRKFFGYSNDVNIDQADLAVDRRVNLACRTPFAQSGFLSDAPSPALGNYATFDVLCQFRQYLGTEDPGPSGDLRAVENSDVTEETWAGYAMATYAGQIGSVPVRGNFGVRGVHTQVTARGLRGDLDIVNNADGTISLRANGNFAETEVTSGTMRWLPSFNAIFDVAPKIRVRTGIYRAMSRPAPSALGAGRQITLETGAGFTNVADAINSIIATGSPRLKPTMSWNADAAFEYYANKDTLFAATLYYKRFTGGLMPIETDEDFTIGGQTYSVPVTQTTNSDDQSDLYGVELTASNQFTWLPRPLDGLGAKLSYNYAWSNYETQDIRYGDVIDSATGVVVPGLIPAAGLSGYSKHVFSAQLFYELGPASIQGIYRYRSRYYQAFTSNNTQLRYVEGNDTFDVNLGLKLNKIADIRFQALNIFNEPRVEYMPIVGSTRNVEYYGPQYFLSLRVRLR
ncbi:TonB-dependent receptor [Sphingomonas psychrotolerans]|uniref:TonB-dependent receptor n=1 Tax=Sphingomonas psychrotolerans TaxID=1327635 RepID=A0A2K8MJC8_9SPHN|nr:TonB-dependent receptor [Sphingomonas psychrotolerans]ATY33963.1 TonB-dependent receptor [Sphingomonas psychrotolerans]